MSIKALNWAIEYPDLKSGQKLLLIALANYADEDGACWPSIKTLMRITGMCNRSVIDNLSNLTQKGIIEKRARGVFGGGRKSNIYVLKVNESEDSALTKVKFFRYESEESRTEPSINHKDKEKYIKKKVFRKPTAAQVTEYGKSIGYDLDGDQFCDHYESNGWKVGKTPMKDWKAAVRTWKRRQHADHKQQTKRSKSQIAADACFGTGPEDLLAMGQIDGTLWPEVVKPMAGRQATTHHTGRMESGALPVHDRDDWFSGGAMAGYMAADLSGSDCPMQASSSSSAAISSIAEARQQRNRNRGH